MPLIRNDKAAVAPATADVAGLARQLRHADADVRWSAARGLAGRAEAAAPLTGALAMEADARVREAILTSLIGLPGSAGIEAVAAQLRSDDSAVRSGAMDALRSVGETVAVVLPALLRDPDPDVRGLACDLARQVSAQEASPLMCERLDLDPEPNVCAAAVDVLAEIGDAAAGAALSRCAARFPDQPFLRFAVRVALDRIAAP